MESIPIFRITKSISVTVAHALYAQGLTPQGNLIKYGVGMGLHGHELKFKITLKSKPDSTFTGQVESSELLEDCLNLGIVEILHGKNLDQEISWFHTRPSSMENIALFVWRNLLVLTEPHPLELEEVKIKLVGTCIQPGSPNSTSVSYRGENVNVQV